jgi:hypothetical protein
MTPRTFKGPALQAIDTWRIKHVTEEDNAGNTILITVPDDEEWQILSVYISYTSSANVGNRRISFTASDIGGAGVYYMEAGVLQPASQAYGYVFGSGVPLQVVLPTSKVLTIPIPTTILAPEQYIVGTDTAAIDAATDGIRMDVQYAYRKI